jgi:hypothetical protein
MSRYPFDPTAEEVAHAESLLGPYTADTDLFVIGYVEEALDHAAEAEVLAEREVAVRKARAMFAARRNRMAGTQ